MACGTDEELSVFIPVRQLASTKLGDVIFRGMPTLRCQLSCTSLDLQPDRVRPRLQSQLLFFWVTGHPAFFVDIAVHGTAGVQSPWGREPNTLPHAGHCSSTDEVSRLSSVSVGTGSVGLSRLLTREDANTLARAFGAQQHPAGRSAAWVHERSTVLMQGVSCQVDSYV